MKSLNDLVNEALFKWADIIGLDLEKSDKYNLRFHTSHGLSQYSLARATEDLNGSRSLDDTGLTTWMMLRGLAESYMKDRTFSAFDIVFNGDKTKADVASMVELYQMLEDDQVVELINEFLAEVRRTAIQFGYKRMDDLEKLLANKYDLSWIRRDAFRSMDRFQIHQFTQGEGDKTPIGMNPNVYEMWNVNSLVRALRSQNIPGITTVLVRDPEALHSYFVIAVKNGDNITILTDKDEEAHPAQKRMSRRPDRDLERRAERHWFPYELLELKASEDGRHLYAEARTGLVPINVNAVKLSTVADLAPAEFVWLMLVSGLIRNKFWVENHHVAELSYTGEMVREPHSLVGETSALVAKGLYEPLVLEPLTLSDLTNEAVSGQWESRPHYFHNWMVERYGAQVPADILNVIGDTNIRQIESSTGVERINTWGEYSRTLEHLDVENFGTREKMVNDRAWAARYNQMIVINKLANQEHADTLAEINEWYRAAIMKRGEFFANAAARGELIAPRLIQVNCHNFNFDTSFKYQDMNLITAQIDHKTYGGKEEGSYSFTGFDRRGGEVTFTPFERGAVYACYDRPEVNASIFTLFTPLCPKNLALFLGMEVEDLPWQLRNWYHHDYEPRGGNSILNRLDPIDWVLDNPWINSHKWRIGMSLSKRAYNARRKALGLPPNVVPEQIKRTRDRY